MFGKKENCVVCGNVVKGSRTKLSDGVLCKECLSKCARELSKISMYTGKEIKEHILFMEKSKITPEQIKSFIHFGSLYVNQKDRQWFFNPNPLTKPKNPVVFDFSDLVDYSVVEDGNTIQKSGLGAAAAGGLLFGGVGLVAGGLMGHKVKSTINKMSITIYVNNPWITNYTITLVNTPVKKGTITYNAVKNNFDQYVKIINTIMAQSQTTSAENTSQYSQTSPTEELKKYKELLDSGAITLEEYNLKKSQLLNL